MDPGKIRLVELIVENFATAYKNYLEAEKLPDNPHNKVAFYAMSVMLIERDPIPDDEIQECLMDQLEEIKFEAGEGQLDRVDMLVIEASYVKAADRRTF